MISRHLGSRISAFVDEELVGPARRRALTHLRGCRSCRDDVTQERLQRQLAAAVPRQDIPAALTDRLLALTANPPAEAVPARPASAGAAAPWGAPADHSRTGRRLALAGAAAGVVALTAAGGLVALGAPPHRGVEALAATAGAPAAVGQGTRVARADDGGWPRGVLAPASLPEGASVVTSQALESGLVRIDVALADGAVTVLETRGRLDLPADTPTRQLGGVTVHEVAGWWVAQLGDDVVAAQGEESAVAQVFTGFQGRGSSLLTRIEAGWQVVLGD